MRLPWAVSRVAAQLLGTAKSAGYPLDPLDIREILLETVDPCDLGVAEDCSRVLAGKLNVDAAFVRLHEIGELQVLSLESIESGQGPSTDRETIKMDSTDNPQETNADIKNGGVGSAVSPLSKNLNPTPVQTPTPVEQSNTNLIRVTEMKTSIAPTPDANQLSVSVQLRWR